MGQANIIKLLERKREWLSTNEIAIKVKVSPGSVSVSLNKLHRQGLVLKRERCNLFPRECNKWKIKLYERITMC